ncbi:TauD/TfdA family dioxygenase [Streptomyces sp. URMC 123]|uniref:TauD/TfdA family dioxygenase n=1 Tax=Streptomyces sp. URMC 123 TaxID=3423403 RepID=UPI003F19B11D
MTASSDASARVVPAVRPPGSLPLSAMPLRVARAHARDILDEFGYVYLHDIPEYFDYGAFLRHFGDFRPCGGGEPVQDLGGRIAPRDPRGAAATAVSLPRTLACEHPGLPPRFLALWCVRPAAPTGPGTALADGRVLLESFSTAERRIMRTRRYEWRGGPAPAPEAARPHSAHPLLDQYGGRDVLRYSAQRVVRVDDGFLPGFVRRGLDFFAEAKVVVCFERRALLLWDNWRMLHARTGTAPAADGAHLKRVLITV